jgi:anti-sigma factor RsiW
MTCEYIERLVEYLDGEMAEGEARELQAHVESCAGCRERMALLRRSYAALDALAAPEAPEGFAERVEARTTRRTFKVRKMLLSVLSAAAMVLLALGVYWAGGERGTEPGTTPVTSVEGLTAEEQAVIENLDVLEDYEVLRDLDMLADYDTLTELDDIETIILPDGELS